MIRDEDFKPNKRGLYAVTFFTDQSVNRQQIIDRFSKVGEVPDVYHSTANKRVFINYKSKEMALKARDTNKDLNVQLQREKHPSDGQGYSNQRKNQMRGGGYVKNKEYNSKDESDSNYGSTAALAPSIPNRLSHHNSAVSLAETIVSDGEKPVSCSIANDGQNLTLNNNQHCQNNGLNGIMADLAISSPVNSVTSNSLTDKDDSDMPPLCFLDHHKPTVDTSDFMETTVVILSNLPPWTKVEHVFKMIFETISIEPYKIEVVIKQKRMMSTFAHVHFKYLEEAELCCKRLDKIPCENRKLICLLAEDMLRAAETGDISGLV